MLSLVIVLIAIVAGEWKWISNDSQTIILCCALIELIVEVFFFPWEALRAWIA